MIARAFGWLGVATGAAIGALLAVWSQAPYPLSVLERNVLTPVVRPGEKVRVELVIDRRARCAQEITRLVQEPDGDRQRVYETRKADYGRMGRDVFVLEVPTDPGAPFGPAEIMSTAEAICNPWQRWLGNPVGSGDPWHDKFVFGPDTEYVEGKHASEYVR